MAKIKTGKEASKKNASKTPKTGLEDCTGKVAVAYDFQYN